MPRPLRADVAASTGGEAEAVRLHILEAAHRVIARDGLAAASSRSIAKEAGIASGTLYNYFENHLQLLAHAILHHIGSLMGPFDDLAARAGTGTVAGNLRTIAKHSVVVLDEMVPLFAAAFSDRQLLDALHHTMDDMAAPDPVGTVERYLVAERDLGRIAPGADCRTAASLLVSVCHDHAFHRFLLGNATRAPSFTKEIDLLVRALAP